MVKLYRNFDINKNDKGAIILIGNFDGVHLGHQKLFKLAQTYKKKYKSKIGVVNFDPMPKMFFNKSLKNFKLSSTNQKINLLKNLSVDFIITKKFDKIFSKTKSINFIKNILSQKLDSRFIFVSNNFRFGNKREGDVKFLIKNEVKYNYKVIKPKPLFIKKKIVSSSLIRSFLEKFLSNFFVIIKSTPRFSNKSIFCLLFDNLKFLSDLLKNILGMGSKLTTPIFILYFFLYNLANLNNF